MSNILTKYRSFWICLVLTLATTAVFYQVCTYDFIYYDDPAYIYLNPDIQAGITLKAIKWAFTTGHTGYWHPLTWLSLMLDYQFFKNWAGGYHIVNVLFHIINTLVLFYVLMRMTGAVWPSAFVAALFALHPLHVESVAWISERKDLLSTFFWLLTMLTYTRYVENPKLKWYLAAIVLFILGLMAKPMLVTLPFVLLLLDYWPFERKISWRLLIEKIPFFICSFLICVVTFLVQKESGIVSSFKAFGWTIRISNAVVSYITYIAKMIWPSRLAMLYPYPTGGLPATKAIICGLLLLLISIYFIYMARRRRFFAVGWLWYLGTLVPVIGLIQSGSQAMADRYTYMTLTGLFIIIAWSAKEFVPKQRHKILALLAVTVLVAWGITAFRQLKYWKDSLTLFEHTLAVTENNYVVRTNYVSCLYEVGRLDEAIKQSEELLKFKQDSAETHSNLGVALLRTGRIQDAIEHFRLAMKYDPNYLSAHFNLAVALQNQGRLQDAVSYYKQSLEIEPNYTDAYIHLAAALVELGRFDEAIGECRKCLQIKPDDPNALNALGTVLGRQGKLDEAVKYLTQALRISPNFAEAHTNLGYALTFQGKPDEAVVHLAEALRLAPNSAKAHYYFGKALLQKGKISETITHFEEALRLRPDWVEPMNDLAWFLAASRETAIRNPDKALRLALRTCELTDYKRPELLDTLAVSYAATGAFDKAVETAQKALELCQTPEQKTLKEQINNRLVLFKAGKPYIETQ